jgi:hypothetical protein
MSYFRSLPTALIVLREGGTTGAATDDNQIGDNQEKGASAAPG